MSATDLNTVCVARLTPPGAAAIAVVGVEGSGAWELVRPLFQSRGKAAPEPGQPDQFFVGKLALGDVADDVVLTLHGDAVRQRVEIHGHGGPAVTAWLLETLRGRGAVEVSWEEWLRRTEPSPLRAAAATALAHAPTLRTAEILLDHYHGALEREIHNVIASLMAEPPQVEGARQRIEVLLKWAALGLHLTKPWRVVAAGPVNAGKSSLINALLGYERAITSPTPGTTRDVLTAVTAFDGWPVELVDTAGLRESADALEAAGVERAVAAAENADLRLWVVDATVVAGPPVPAPSAVPTLTVLNKVDLLGGSFEATSEAVATSALTGTGVGELAATIVRRLVPEVPSPQAAVPFAAEQVAALQAAAGALAAGDHQRAVAELKVLVSYGTYRSHRTYNGV